MSRHVTIRHGFARAALIAVLAGAAACRASAQQQAVAVQLPTFSFFSVNTSVIVPDSGAGIRAWMARQAAQRRAPGLSKNESTAEGCTLAETLRKPTEAEAFALQLRAARGSSAPSPSRGDWL